MGDTIDKLVQLVGKNTILSTFVVITLCAYILGFDLKANSSSNLDIAIAFSSIFVAIGHTIMLEKIMSDLKETTGSMSKILEYQHKLIETIEKAKEEANAMAKDQMPDTDTTVSKALTKQRILLIDSDIFQIISHYLPVKNKLTSTQENKIRHDVSVYHDRFITDYLWYNRMYDKSEIFPIQLKKDICSAYDECAEALITTINSNTSVSSRISLLEAEAENLMNEISRLICERGFA